MYNKKYYLVSPRVDGVTIQGFIETMFERHIVMMGWGTDNKIGADFNNLNKGDFVIVAQRVNWVFTYYFAGIIDDEQGFSNDGYLCRKLRSFVDLRGCNDNLLADVSFASMSVIKAMMSINPSNNIEIIKKLDKIIAMQENKDYVNSFVSLLKSNHNLILTGAPGTGKTYLAKQIAEAMGANEDTIKMVQFHPSYDYTDFVEGLRPVKDGNTLGFQRRDGVFKDFCKNALLHSNHACLDDEKVKTFFEKEYKSVYQEIKEGILTEIPIGNGNTKKTFCSENGQWGLTTGRERKNGKPGDLSYLKSILKYVNSSMFSNGNYSHFENMRDVIGGNTSDIKYVIQFLYNRISKKTKNENNIPYVFIIDEINRGEISKIFGELFYSIDSGYRGTKGRVNTQYQNLVPDDDVFSEGFYIPENVYIIGTMNDIDRSVESMDFAMRRRFAWKEITAESRQSMLDEDEAWDSSRKPSKDVIAEMKVRMNNLNACIIDKYKVDEEELSPKDRIGLTEAYQIGAAYFLKYGMYGNFDDLWTNHLKGLLYEYLRGTTNIESKIERLQKAYNDTTVH